MELKNYRYLLCILLLLFANDIFAGTTGKIVGKITDQNSGEPLPGANVVLEGTSRGASTDADGFYIIINVPPGTFKLEVYYVGYTTVSVENVNVSIDRTTKQNVGMSTEVLTTDVVVVEAERPAVEMDRTHTASIVSTQTIEAMPVTSLREVIELQSGVVSSGGELHFRGGRGREVAYLIDGVPVSNDYGQGGGISVDIENSMVQELEVISGTFNAEYGSAQSGIVNIITKRPARKFSGSVQTYAGEWFSNKSDIYLGIDDFNPLAEKDVQFSLSGPIISDKLGFYVSGRYNNWESSDWYERRYMPLDGWKIAAYENWFQQHNQGDVSSSLGINIPDSLRTGDGARGPLSTGNSTTLSAKLNYFPTSTFTLSYKLFASYNQSKGGGSSKRYQPDETATSKSWAHSHFFSFSNFPSNKFFYNISFSYQHNNGESYYLKDNDIALYPGDSGIQPFGYSSNGFSLGSTPGFYSGAAGKGYRDKYLLSADLNWQFDKYNFIKAGFIAKQHKVNTYSWGFRETKDWETKKWPSLDDLNGADYEFDDYWNLISDYWRNWETIYDTPRYVTYADSEYTQWRDYTIEPFEAAFYLQDKVEMGDIIINAGLRLDLFIPNEKYPVQLRTEAENLGSEQNLKESSTKYQLSPRLGISFPISSNGAFHASYGHFFQMPSFHYMYNEPLRAMTSIQLDGRTLGNADLKAERTIAYEIGLQQELGYGVAVDVTAYYKDFRNLLGLERITTIDAIGYDRYINRDYGNTKGISIALNKGYGLISGGLNYTFAYANGSSSDPNSLYLVQSAARLGGEPVTFVERKILPLDWDQKHTINVYANFSQANNWSIGLVGNLYSGTPYSPTFVERFDIITREYRNLEIKPIRWNIDLKAKKHINLGGLNSIIFLKIDNLFDNLNHETVHSSTGRADQIARLPENKDLLVRTLEQEGNFTLQEIDNNPGYYSSPRKMQVGLEVNF